LILLFVTQETNKFARRRRKQNESPGEVCNFSSEEKNPVKFFISTYVLQTRDGFFVMLTIINKYKKKLFEENKND
jgi:hypothetical protein